VLKLIRRRESDFLPEKHRRALKARLASARALAANAALTATARSQRIGYQCDNFRAGKTSAGTFAALWDELLEMSFHKCALCETPAPDTVEHLEEKSIAPDRAFAWPNLLAACDTCNRRRENSGIAGAPLDPSDGEPLDYLGWDEYGGFVVRDPARTAAIERHVEMYGLKRFARARATVVRTVRKLLSVAVNEQPVQADARDALQDLLTGNAAWLGPVREYLLRPPSEDDALLLDEVLRKLPAIRQWVAPWLRPPPWALAIWR
jgi:5-methylcytosine-specific restriction endonuclease McrA